jgi:hypothetical protein
MNRIELASYLLEDSYIFESKKEKKEDTPEDRALVSKAKDAYERILSKKDLLTKRIASLESKISKAPTPKTPEQAKADLEREISRVEADLAKPEFPTLKSIRKPVEDRLARMKSDLSSGNISTEPEAIKDLSGPKQTLKDAKRELETILSYETSAKKRTTMTAAQLRAEDREAEIRAEKQAAKEAAEKAPKDYSPEELAEKKAKKEAKEKARKDAEEAIHPTDDLDRISDEEKKILGAMDARKNSAVRSSKHDSIRKGTTTDKAIVKDEKDTRFNARTILDLTVHMMRKDGIAITRGDDEAEYTPTTYEKVMNVLKAGHSIGNVVDVAEKSRLLSIAEKITKDLKAARTDEEKMKLKARLEEINNKIRSAKDVEVSVMDTLAREIETIKQSDVYRNGSVAEKEKLEQKISQLKAKGSKKTSRKEQLKDPRSILTQKDIEVADTIVERMASSTDQDIKKLGEKLLDHENGSLNYESLSGTINSIAMYVKNNYIAKRQKWYADQKKAKEAAEMANIAEKNAAIKEKREPKPDVVPEVIPQPPVLLDTYWEKYESRQAKNNNKVEHLLRQTLFNQEIKDNELIRSKMIHEIKSKLEPDYLGTDGTSKEVKIAKLRSVKIVGLEKVEKPKEKNRTKIGDAVNNILMAAAKMNDAVNETYDYDLPFLFEAEKEEASKDGYTFSEKIRAKLQAAGVSDEHDPSIKKAKKSIDDEGSSEDIPASSEVSEDEIRYIVLQLEGVTEHNNHMVPFIATVPYFPSDALNDMTNSIFSGLPLFANLLNRKSVFNAGMNKLVKNTRLKEADWVLRDGATFKGNIISTEKVAKFRESFSGDTSKGKTIFVNGENITINDKDLNYVMVSWRKEKEALADLKEGLKNKGYRGCTVLNAVFTVDGEDVKKYTKKGEDTSDYQSWKFSIDKASQFIRESERNSYIGNPGDVKDIVIREISTIMRANFAGKQIITMLGSTDDRKKFTAKMDFDEGLPVMKVIYGPNFPDTWADFLSVTPKYKVMLPRVVTDKTIENYIFKVKVTAANLLSGKGDKDYIKFWKVEKVLDGNGEQELKKDGTPKTRKVPNLDGTYKGVDKFSGFSVEKLHQLLSDEKNLLDNFTGITGLEILSIRSKSGK